MDDQITKENELKQNQQKINQTIQDLKDLIDLPSNNPFIGEAKQHAKID
ncbi:MAG: hypothetical protein HWD61_08875 [Parachlamydiaceae bacterium]|nr:MAG: hypothetical protein HWD61_08875 [Parachlamydiaceae bacterium]